MITAPIVGKDPEVLDRARLEPVVLVLAKAFQEIDEMSGTIPSVYLTEIFAVVLGRYLQAATYDPTTGERVVDLAKVTLAPPEQPAWNKEWPA